MLWHSKENYVARIFLVIVAQSGNLRNMFQFFVAVAILSVLINAELQR